MDRRAVDNFFQERGWQTDLRTDGGWHRFSTDGTPDKDGSYSLSDIGGCLVGLIMDWKTGEEVRLTYERNGEPDEEWKKNRLSAQKKLRENRENIDMENARNMLAFRLLWNSADQSGSSPYLIKKQCAKAGDLLPEKHAFRVRFDGECMLVSVETLSGDIMGIQRIYPDSSKRFSPGTQKKGLSTGSEGNLFPKAIFLSAKGSPRPPLYLR